MNDDWIERTNKALQELSAQTNAAKRAKSLALVAAASRRRDPLGRFLRNKHPAKRLKAEGREIMRASIPLALAETIYAEAGDAKISGGRMLAVLAALGLPIWMDMRERFITGDFDAIVLPDLIRAILSNAVCPTPPRNEKARAHWQQRVEEALLAAKPKKRKIVDPTAAVLAGLGGGKPKP